MKENKVTENQRDTWTGDKNSRLVRKMQYFPDSVSNGPHQVTHWD